MRNILLLIGLLFTGLPFTMAQSTDLDKKIGLENAMQVEREMGLYPDKEKTEYVRKVGMRLVNQLDPALFDYQIHIVPEVSPNAFALPGGYFYITIGILPLFESEDEMACVMAHEIIHSNNRHGVRQMKKSILPKLLELPGDMLTVLAGPLGVLFNAPIKTTNALIMASYSRDYETEADLEGITLAAKAGYDPEAMERILTRMSSAIEKATGQKEQKSYFNDHPYTPDRASALRKKSKSLKYSKRKNVSANFKAQFDSLLFGTHPAGGVIREHEFLHPDLDFYVNFPKGWQLVNQPQLVGAIHPEQRGLLGFTLDETGMSPEQTANKLLEELDSKERAMVDNKERVKVGDKDAYLVTFKQTQGFQTGYIHVLWLEMEEKMFRFIGSASEDLLPLLEKAVSSLRPLTQNEKESIKIQLMRVVRSEAGETLKELSERSGNTMELDLLGVINAVDVNTPLQAGSFIKVIKEYPYKPSSY